MSQRLLNKTIVISAAGAGIGRCCAQRALEEGAIVWATDIGEAALAELKAKHPTINTAVLDVTDTAAI